MNIDILAKTYSTYINSRAGIENIKGLKFFGKRAENIEYIRHFENHHRRNTQKELTNPYAI